MRGRSQLLGNNDPLGGSMMQGPPDVAAPVNMAASEGTGPGGSGDPSSGFGSMYVCSPFSAS